MRVQHQMLVAAGGPAAGTSNVARTGRPTRRGQRNRQEKRDTYPRINREIIATAERGTLRDLLELVQQLISEMNLVNLSTAMHRIAKLSNRTEERLMVQTHPLMPKLSAAVRSALRERQLKKDASPNSQALSNITWALATIEYVDVQLVQVAALLAVEQITEFKPFELSGLLWALAKLGRQDGVVVAYGMPVFKEAARLIPEIAEQFHFRCLVMTLCAFATAEEYDASLFYGLAPRLSPAVKQASCQELVNIIWAYSSAGICHERLFEQVALEVLPRIAEFKPEELGSLFASYADVGLLETYFFSGRVAWELTTDPMLVHLLESLLAAKESGGTRAAISQVFLEASRRAASMEKLDLQALAEVCRKRGHFLGSAPEVEDVVRCCSLLGQVQCADNEDIVGADVQAWYSEASASSSSDEFDHDSTTAEEDSDEDLPCVGSNVSTEASLPPMPAIVLDPRAKPADAAATEELSTCLHLLHATSSGSSSFGSEEQQQRSGKFWTVGSGAVQNGEAMQLTCTVKNTFLDVYEESCSKDEEDQKVCQAELCAPLDILPADISPYQLQTFRMEYQNFRLGKAMGAKGELQAVCC